MATEYDELHEHYDNNCEEYNSAADIKLQDSIVQTGDFLDSKGGISLISAHNITQGVLLENIKEEYLNEQLSKDVDSIENCERCNSTADIKLVDCIVQTGDFLDSKAGISSIRDHILAQGVSLGNIKVENLDEESSEDIVSTENCEKYNSDADIKLEDFIVQTGDFLDSKVGISLISDHSVAHGALLENIKIENSNDQSNKSFKHKQLYDHVRSVRLPKKIHMCGYCGRTFHRKDDLTVHTRVHTGEKPFTCEICKKSFCVKTGLRRHIRTHTGEKPFTCEVCKKSFSQKSVLTIHIQTHTGEKPFTCEVCKKSFGFSVRLRKHMAMHMGYCPHSCELCLAKFTTLSNLTLHMKQHIKEKV